MTTVAIIGAGPSGLVAAKEALACGLTPTVLEKANTIGGLWRPGSGGVWDSMRTNISHHTCLFSDFEWKKDVQDFPTRDEMYDYICSYAETFKINPCVRLNSEVLKIERKKEKWVIEWFHDDQQFGASFDHVIVCSGIFSKAFTPNIPGLDTLTKPVIHSSEYKSSDSFEGKTVAVVGNAFSGCEISADITRKADHVVNILRRPLWILPRYLAKQNVEYKLPADLIFYSRAAAARSEGVDPEIVNERKNNWFSSICAEQNQVSSDLTLSVPSKEPPFVTITDGYLENIKTGKISIQTGSISNIENDCLIVEGKDPIPFDALVFCTGYRAHLPFFNTDACNALEFDPDDPLQPLLLHKTIFHPQFPNMAFVGMYRGPYFGIMELQARIATMTLSGKIPAPSISDMENGIALEKEIRSVQPRPQFPHGAYVSFADDLAKQIGALPDFKIMETENPDLYQKLWFGPFSAASFRLSGFGSNPEVAMRIIDRINKAT